MKIGIKNNKIKTKSNAPKGFRAVECACCGGGGCGNCPSLKSVFGVSTLSISGMYDGVSLAANGLSLVEPFTYYEEDISQPWDFAGLMKIAASDLCGVGVSQQTSYGINAGFSVMVGNVTVDGVTKCGLTAGASYSFFGPADYTAYGGGSKGMHLPEPPPESPPEWSPLPITFNFNVVGQSVYTPFCSYDENGNMDCPPSQVNPFSFPCTITLS